MWLTSAPALDDLPGEVTAVVSLCRLGTRQVSTGLRHLEFRLIDDAASHNPNAEFVIDDAAATVRRWREEGEVVALHCVAAQSRTPTVGARYSQRLGVERRTALREVCEALPSARPNRDFRQALKSLTDTDRSA